MKTKTTLLIFTTALLMSLFASNLRAQITPEFEFYLAFEDGVGNKDTIFVGYDTQATDDIDSVFGENDIKNTTFDSVFEVRIANIFSNIADDYGYVNNDYTNFHTKKQILNTTCLNPTVFSPKAVSILIHSKYYPIKVKWNNSNSFNFVDSCLYNSLFNYVNPSHWCDIGTFYSSVSPCFFNNFLRLNDSIVFDSILVYIDPLSSYNTKYINLPPEHYIDANGDTIRLLYFGFFKEFVAKTKINKQTNILIYPNPAQNYINFEGLDSNPAEIEIYDVLGRLVLEQEISNETNSVSIRKLSKGINFIKFITDKGVFVKKIIKY